MHICGIDHANFLDFLASIEAQDTQNAKRLNAKIFELNLSLKLLV